MTIQGAEKCKSPESLGKSDWNDKKEPSDKSSSLYPAGGDSMGRNSGGREHFRKLASQALSFS